MISARNHDPASWNRLLASLPNPHLLQTWEWAQVKARYGWQPMPFVWREPAAEGPGPAGGSAIAAAMVLKRAIPVGGFARKMCLLYAPKGPLMDWRDAALRRRVLDDLQSLAKREGAIFLKIDPDVVVGTGIPGSADERPDDGGQAVQYDLIRRGWTFSPDQVQFRNTVLIDLSFSEEELLARMKQKTRYNIRLAEKKGVRVRAGTLNDLPLLYRMYAETSARDGFVIRDEGYYRTVWETFMRSRAFGLEHSNAGTFEPASTPVCEPLIAEVEGRPVAAIFVFTFAKRAYYLYGMSRNEHREKMPNHLLQWEAMRRAKAVGCTTYDLWGAPDVFDERDGMWGVFRFKEGLGGQVVRTLGAWDYPPSPLWYRWYTRVIPRLLDIMRSRGRKRVQEEARRETKF